MSSILQDEEYSEDIADLDDDLYDDTPGYDEDTDVQLTPGLSDEDRRKASIFYRLFDELWGLCIIVGEPGAGKDTFLNWMLHTLKRYFPNKQILRDDKPRRLFGPYAGLFNESRIQDDLKSLRDIARGVREEVGGQKYDGNYMLALENAADDWAKGDSARILLQNSIVGLTEYWKYVNCREPHSPFNKTMGGIHKMGRHFPTLIFGCVQLESDLDKKSSKPFVKWKVMCTRHPTDTTRYIFYVYKVRYDKRLDLLTPISKPFTIPVDAGKPRSYLGDGLIRIKRPKYLPETEEEALVLSCIKVGINRYEDLVETLQLGGMTERETLLTVKSLGLRLQGKRPKMVLDYPCDYKLFNSRNAPNLTSKVKVGD